MTESYILEEQYFGQYYWPGYFPLYPGAVAWVFGEVFRANVVMNMSVLANTVMNTAVNESVPLNRTVTDTYNELESL